MKKCTQTDKPSVSILLSVYNPNLNWLKEQLCSLNSQTYPNIKIYIRDDCSPDVSFEEIKSLVSECITGFPVDIEKNEKNLGYNKSFEKMTAECDGKYIAYCDQDDIWTDEKIEKMQKNIEQTGATLVCSDMHIIDGEGNYIADSITKTRKHHIFKSGEGLTESLWYTNFASGCALLVCSDIAKAAIPFNPFMYYDHYVTLFAASKGSISFIDEPLIFHREHGNNQSSSPNEIHDKESYYKVRVETVFKAVNWLYENFPADENFKKLLTKANDWMTARFLYSLGRRKYFFKILKGFEFSKRASLFEVMLPFIPKRMFDYILGLRRKNKI